MKLSPLLGLGLILFPALAIAAPNACTLDGVTGDCAGFRETDPPLRRLKDGTYIPNYAAITKKKSPAQEQAEENEIGAKLENNFNLVGKAIAAVLDRFGTKLSSDVHISISQLRMGQSWIPIVFDKDLDFDAVVPWPLEQEGAPAQPVKRRQVQKELRRLMGEDGFQALRMAYSMLPKSAPVVGKDEVREKLLAISSERKAHVDALVTRTKTLLEGQILQGRTEASLSTAERNAILKIRKIKQTPFAELQQDANCQGPVSQAYFNPLDHSINICPNFYNFPDATIVSVIGHEMGHAVDACNSQFGVFSINKSAISSLKTDNGGSISSDPKINEDEKKGNAFQLLQYMSGRGMSPSSFPLDLQISSETLDFFKANGCIKEEVAGTPLESYLLRDSYDCLIQKKKFKSTSDMTKLVNQIVTLRASEQRDGYRTPEERDANRAKMNKAFAKHPECMPGNEKSEMGEVMADYLGSRALGEFLKTEKKSPENQDEKIAPLSFFASLSCMEKNSTADEKKDESTYDILDGAYADARKLYDPHPIAVERMEKIFMGDAELRKYLGCAPISKAEACDHDYRHVSRGPIGTSTVKGTDSKSVKGN